jgi:hypothetical protein
MRRGWLLVLLAIVLVGAGFGIGYAVADDGHGADNTHGLQNDRMAGMMADGSMPAQMDDFIKQMKELRSQMTPEMQAQMDQDAMWQRMETGDLMQMMRKHGAQMAEMPGMNGGGRHGR